MSQYTNLPFDVLRTSETDAIATSLFDSLDAGANISITKVTISGDEKIRIAGTGMIGGSGTANKLPKWATSTTLGNSIVEEDVGATMIGFGVTPTSGRVHIKGVGTSGATNALYITDSASAVLFKIQNNNKWISERTSGGWLIGAATADYTGGSIVGYVFEGNNGGGIFSRITADVSGLRDPMTLVHRTSGDATDGFGLNLHFSMYDTAATLTTMSAIASERDGADNTGYLFMGTGASTNLFGINKNANIGIGGFARGDYDGTGTNLLAIKNGTAPSGGITDAWQVYSLDAAGAGTASPRFVTEDGTLITLAETSTMTGLVLSGTFRVSTADGMDVIPSSDMDADLITVGVTGTPIFKWDESKDTFRMTPLSVVIPGAAGGERLALTLGNEAFTSAMMTTLKFEAGTDGGSERDTAAIKAEQSAAQTGNLHFHVDKSGLVKIMTLVSDGEIKIFNQGETNPTVTADTFSFWAEDASGVGTCSPAFKTEDGTTITLAAISQMVDLNLSGLDASKIVETSAGKQLISAAKNSAYNKAFASSAEIDTGTEAAKPMAPSQYVASDRNIRFIEIRLFESDTDVATGLKIRGDFRIPFDGTIIQRDGDPELFTAYNDTAGVTGTMVLDVNVDGTTIMTVNKLDIETGEKTTATAATQPDLTTTAVTAGQIMTFDVDAIHSGTAAKGLVARIPIRMT